MSLSFRRGKSPSIQKRHMHTFSFMFLLTMIPTQPFGATISCIILSFFLALYPKHFVKYSLLAFYVTSLNPSVFTSDPFSRYLFLFPLIILSIVFLIRSGIKLLPNFFMLTIFSLIFLHCLIVSEAPLVSISKFLLWAMVFISISVLANLFGKSPEFSRDVWMEEIRTIVYSVMILSIPFAFLDIGYFVNGTGFQGVMNHPQSFGFVASVCCLLLFDHVIRDKISMLRMGILLVSLLFVVMSESRSALLITMLGMATQVCSLEVRRPGFPRRLGRKTVVTLLLSFVLAPFLYTQLGVSLGAKAGLENSTVLQAYEISRGGLLLIAAENILARPSLGIGWGVPSDLQINLETAKFVLGIPISVPVEKGIFLVALVEEIGVWLSLGFLVSLFSHFELRNNDSLYLLVAVFLYNFTENVFTSVGGMGFFCLVILISSVKIRSRKVSTRVVNKQNFMNFE